MVNDPQDEHTRAHETPPPRDPRGVRCNASWRGESSRDKQRPAERTEAGWRAGHIMGHLDDGRRAVRDLLAAAVKLYHDRLVSRVHHLAGTVTATSKAAVRERTKVTGRFESRPRLKQEREDTSASQWVED